jgi:hypothetical protein
MVIMETFSGINSEEMVTFASHKERRLLTSESSCGVVRRSCHFCLGNGPAPHDPTRVIHGQACIPTFISFWFESLEYPH